MFGADVLTFREFAMREPLPLAAVHKGVLEFLRGRDDVVVFGAQAVNAYVNEPRMTQRPDLLSTHADVVAQQLRDNLHQRLRIAVRVRRVSEGQGCGYFRCGRLATGIWWTCDPSSRCRQQSASMAYW